MSRKDLKPNITSKEQAVEMGRKGGKSRSKRKALCKIKYCTTKCPIYPCVWQPLSKNYKEKNRELCAKNQQPPHLIKKWINLLSKDEDAFNTEMSNMLLKITNPKDFIYCGDKVHKMKFGDKIKAEISETPFIEDMRKWLKKLN